jgi:uncharacterized protein YdeI (YjbR/CyaY-like superfamily)
VQGAGDLQASGLKPFHARTRAAWRRWLERNHARSPGVWLVSYKKATGKPFVPWSEAVDEALCFGWIDSLRRPLDAERFQQLFTPRKPRSGWSAINKRKVAALVRAGLMTPAGLAKVEAAQRDGSWTRNDAVEALEVPEDLAVALARNPAAARNFGTLPPSARRGLLGWIHEAKKPETRARRVADTVACAERKLRDPRELKTKA